MGRDHDVDSRSSHPKTAIVSANIESSALLAPARDANM
uniref:Uncharacterized protein n=1 Tax=Verrucosispora sp. MS100047 TaxID=1410949 RepID=A0A097CTC8_9ACTN|nr:hypothetical protein VASRM7_645 [Verrucosispora sp. MS100047]